MSGTATTAVRTRKARLFFARIEARPSRVCLRCAAIRSLCRSPVTSALRRPSSVAVFVTGGFDAALLPRDLRSRQTEASLARLVAATAS